MCIAWQGVVIKKTSVRYKKVVFLTMIISLIINFSGIEFFDNAHLISWLVTERTFFLH